MGGRTRASVLGLLVVAAHGCTCLSQGNGSGGPDAAAGDDPRWSTTPPAALLASLPTTDDGKPILLESTANAAPGTRVAFVWNETLDDPIVRWGQCLSQVLRCQRSTAKGAPVAPCVRTIPACADERGGKGCCPRACATRFATAVDAGTEEQRAIDDVFVSGDCVPGFSAQLGGVTP